MTAEATERRAPLLNQVIAVRATVKNDIKDALTPRYRLLGQKPLLSGLSRSYEPNNDDGYRYPGESQQVQVSTETVLKEISSELTRLFDVEAAVDWTNQHARADIVLFGTSTPFVLLQDVPVTYLMFLEKQLVDLETVIRKLPVLDPGEKWTYDPTTDWFRSEPVKTVKSKKVPRNHVLAEATDRHPAQVQVWQEDIPEGTWTTTKFSGALPANRVRELLNRVTTLAEAVRYARERANLEGVVTIHPGKPIFDFLFAEDPF